jgi:hypothetical protein
MLTQAERRIYQSRIVVVPPCGAIHWKAQHVAVIINC